MPLRPPGGQGLCCCALYPPPPKRLQEHRAKQLSHVCWVNKWNSKQTIHFLFFSILLYIAPGFCSSVCLTKLFSTYFLNIHLLWDSPASSLPFSPLLTLLLLLSPLSSSFLPPLFCSLRRVALFDRTSCNNENILYLCCLIAYLLSFSNVASDTEELNILCHLC